MPEIRVIKIKFKINFLLTRWLFLYHCRVKTIITHMRSTVHLASSAAQDPNQPKMAAPKDTFGKYSAKQVEAAIGGLKTAFFCIMEEIPDKKFKALQAWGRHMDVQSLADLRVNEKATHDSPKIFNQVCIFYCTSMLGCFVSPLYQGHVANDYDANSIAFV